MRKLRAGPSVADISDLLGSRDIEARKLPQQLQATMLAPARRRCAQGFASASILTSESIPAFLLPAFQVPTASRAFATTSPCLSKIGSAPLSIPPEVTFRIAAPPARGRGTRVQARPTVHIKGPLGELSMEIPPYVNIDQDPSLPGPTLTVQDSRDAKQRAMWGMRLR